MNEPLAIVGMSCRLPGADGLDAYWDLVLNRRAAWGTLPESRLDRELYFTPEKGHVGKSYSELGGLVSERRADPRVCPITPELEATYDVAHHILLEVASLACRDAGLDPFAMPRDRRIGVYVGHTGGSSKISDFVYSTGIDESARLLADLDEARGLLGPAVETVADELTARVRERHPGRSPDDQLDLSALGAARIVQEALRLTGPYLVVDAACASSLQAMAIAARALAAGSIDQAIVGGASYCKSDSLVLFSQAQSVSNSGSCPFGEVADGLVTAEGYVVLVLKTLAKAVADGDRIRAVIRGIGVASDGKGKSLWAPRPEGQVLAVQRAYPEEGDLTRLDYIEAHATSTQVGDATELTALSKVLADKLPRGRQIPIGSVKANVGHTLETAGLAGLVKVVLAMEHGMIPPGSTCKDLNPEFDWKHGPFTVPFTPVPWPRHADGTPRTAAVNAFGIGGLNVHVALAEHVPGPTPASPVRRRGGDDDAIAVVGMGSVLPGAVTAAAFFDLLDQGRTAVTEVPTDRWNLARALDPSGPATYRTLAGWGGFVQGFAYDWRRHKVPPKQIAAANPLQFMLLDAADAALAEAGFGGPAFDRTRTGVVVGTMFGGEFSNQLQMGLRLPETGRFLRSILAGRGVVGSDADRVIKAYEKRLLDRYPALIDETGSFTSSTLASRLTKSFDLMGGALALDAGDCSSVAAIAAAVDMLRGGDCDMVVCASGERAADLMKFEGCSLTGDLARRAGCSLDAVGGGRLPAEGAVVLVLRRLTDARKAGNTIHAVIRGVGLTCGDRTPAIAAEATRLALADAGLAAGAVTALEFNGCGSKSYDVAALQSIGGTYDAADAGRTQPVALGSTEGLVGHVGAAGAAISIMKLSRALASGMLPATVGLARSTTISGLLASGARQPIAAVPASDYRAAGIHVMQEQQAGHVIVDNGAAVPASARATQRPAAGAVPLPTAAPLPVASGRPLVAALFPGQGSQYTDMFRGLVEGSAEGRSAIAPLDAAARQAGLPTLAETAWRADNGLGTVVWDTQWAMYLGDLVAWNVLAGMGFKPDVIASHSFGEFPSLVAAGGWSLADGIAAARARAAAVDRSGPKDGAMLSVIADSGTIATVVAPFTGSVWVCAENGPEQSVLGGQARVVDKVEAAFESRGVRTKRLAVPCPFHTPLLATAADQLAATIATLPIRTPSTSVLGSTLAAPLMTPADVRESLVRQMTQTVRWTSVIERLYDAGVRVFVEVGPSTVLCGLVRRILEGRPGVKTIAFDQRGKPAHEHLTRLRAQLEEAGALAAKALPVEAAVGEITQFDATARRRARNRGAGAAAPKQPAMAAARGRNGDAPQRQGGGNGSGGEGTDGPAPLPARGNGSSGGRLAGFEHLPRFAAMNQPATTTLADDGPSTLVDTIRGVLAEYGAGLPLARTAAADACLETLRDLFDLSTSVVTACREATTLDQLTALLSGTGGKNEWLAAASAGSTAPSSAAGAGEIEAYLVDFVVEQTGYPKEIVELDADLESDLGIDSIRKAQLFGEIGQKYGLSADDSVSLDEFPTLRHLLDYIVPRVGGTTAASPEQPVVARPERNGHHANGHDERNGHAGRNGHPADVAVTHDGGDRAAEIETFLVDFVVEQTGYPKEIVELDADLESDLGIDSIRKAQLFGEIGQKYGLSADDSVSLDEFPTLRHLLDYIVPRVGGTTAAHLEQPASARPERNGHHANGHHANGHDANGHHDNGHGAALGTAGSNGHADRNGHHATVAAPPDGHPRAAEIETFLVDFVVEQTGYPREIVELDADLEADLGIDSIRKAQLFGEIGQKYGLSADDSVSLDEFPTLRHLLDYMLPRIGGAAAAPARAVPSPTPRSADFERGLAVGRSADAALRSLTRQAILHPSTAATRSLAAQDLVAGLAEGSGCDALGVAAALWSPEAAVGGFESVVVADASTQLHGFAVGIRRHGALESRPLPAGGAMLGVAGLPGAIAGWNAAGLVVVSAGRRESEAAANPTPRPVTLVVESLLETCRSVADVQTAVRGLLESDRRLIAFDAASQAPLLVASDGTTRPATAADAVDSRGPLGRIVVADCEDQIGAALVDLLRDRSPIGARLAPSCGWVAWGVTRGRWQAQSGGPAAGHAAALPDDATAAVLARPFPAPADRPTVAEITRRYELLWKPLPAATPTRNLRGEHVVLLGEGPFTTELAAAFRGAGATVSICTPRDDVAGGLRTAEAAAAVRHLVVTTAATLGHPARQAVETSFFACQHWLALRERAGDRDRATLTAVTRLGGDFGLAGRIDDVAGGGVAGLFKGLSREFPDLQVRVIDVDRLDAPAAAAIVGEMRSSGPVEVTLGGGRRGTIAAVDRPVPAAIVTGAALARGSTWVVTGGARGVTAACALDLARRFGLRLELVGSTTPVDVDPSWLALDADGMAALKKRVMLEARGAGREPRAAWQAVEKSIEIARSVRRFAAAGVDARYHAFDLADRHAVAAAIDTIRRTAGPIRGVIHGAGWESACRFEKKTAEHLARTFGPKCTGLENLLEALAHDPLEMLVGFGSTSGRLGGHGQADYSLSNDYLAKRIVRARSDRPGLKATVFHWHAWDEVGMASRPESQFVLKQFGLRFMPLAEGVGRFVDEIRAGLPVAEVLVTEPVFCQEEQSTTQQPTGGSPADTSLAEVAPGGNRSARVTFDPTADRFLLDHRQFGRPLLPAVMAVETLAQAAIATGCVTTVGEIRDFRVERPLNFPVDAPRTVEVGIDPAATGVRAVGRAEIVNSAGRSSGALRDHFAGTVVGGAAESIATRLQELPFPYNPMVYPEDAPMFHGPQLRPLTGLLLDRNGGWGRLVASDPAGLLAPRSGTALVPAALLDGCFVACGVFSWLLAGKRVEIPCGFDRLRLFDRARIGEVCTVRLDFRSQDPSETRYDFVLYGDDARPLAAIDGLRMVVLSGDAPA